MRGIEHLATLIDAATNKQTLIIGYCSFDEQEHTWIIYPYYLKQYNNRWFLFGLNESFNSISNLPLDRIEIIKVTELPFKENQYVDFDTYFDDIIGVTKPDVSIPLETITLKFDQRRFPYILSKPIHPSQKIVDESNGIIEIQVRPNKELEALVLSFGPQVEVLSPASLRNLISNKIAENLKKYFPVQLDRTEAY